MKTKRFLCLILVLAMILPCMMGSVVTVTAADASEETATADGYVTEGLVALYSGTQNTRAGHDTNASVWEDLVGGYDVTVTKNDKNYFTEDGLKVSAAQNYFPQAIVDTVNGDAFTVEISMADLVSTADAYSTIMNSTNDKFALFRRISEDVLEFKFSGNAASDRNKVQNCLALLQDALITVTYEVGGESIIYINGQVMSSMPAPASMGAGDLFFGHSEGRRHFDALYRSIRFYDRALTSAEVKRNAAADGFETAEDAYVSDGLVSLYSGTSNTEAGYDPDATVWEDLAGDNDLPIAVSDKSYFTEEGLYVTGVEHYFPRPIVDLINGQAFTVELSFGEFISIGGDFNTFLNSKNDHFALFRRNSNNVLEFKFAANPGNERPTVPDGLNLIDHSTVSVTYEVGGKCRIFVDGLFMAEVASPKAMGADNLFIGHAEASKLFETTYRSIRFYNRALTDQEIARNAVVDGNFAGANTPEDLIPTYISVAQPKTNIVGDISVTREITSAGELTAMMAAQKLPAAAIYMVNDKLELLDNSGKPFSTLSEVLVATEYKILPILIPVDAATVDAIAAFIGDTRFADICILSKDAALVNAARTKMPTVRGAIDLTEAYKDVTLTREMCLDIRRTVKSNAASVAVLPADIAAQDMVQYLYDNQINVWVRADDDLDATETYHALLSGATGVISDDTTTLLTAACDLPDNTMTRMPLNVGHRAIPSKAPENTVEGALYAYEHGADCIEIDVYLSKDGEIVVMHDGTTGRTCNRDLPVEGSTWAQLSELYVNKGYESHATYKNCRIPRLQDFLETFKDTDCRFFIEIKTNQTAIVKKIKAMVDEYGMYGQCSVITFNTGIMEAMRRDYPEMSVGALCSGYMSEANPDADMKAVMGFIGKSNATLNPSYSGYGEKAVRAALIRGIGVFPWTFRGDAGVYQNHFIWGYSALTGDNADVLKRFVKSVEKILPDIEVGLTVELGLHAIYYDRREADVDTEIVVLEGADAVTVDGHRLTLREQYARVVVFLKHTYRLGNQSITLCSQPALLNETIFDDTQPEDTQPDEPVETEPVTDEVVTDESDTDEIGTSEPETDPAETDVSETDGSETDDPETNAPETEKTATDITNAPETEATTPVTGETNAVTDAETSAEGGGCGSVISGISLGVLSVMAICAFTLKRNKKEY
ncbi:MAG: hypothetical protein E7661_08280 [Ruminococcaceae bacterium]|nr:hypothetical protein [Oscillospiraceae bacterium]